MTPKTSLEKCRHIFLDTTTILDLFKTGSNDSIKNRRIEITEKLFEFFRYIENSNPDYQKIFYISALSISEIKHSLNGEPLFRLIEVLQTENMVVLSFDRKVAQYAMENFEQFMNNKQHLNEKITNSEFLTGDYRLAREWVSMDYKIAITGKYYNVDLILTGDSKTFKPVCDEIFVPCLVMENQSFQFSQGGDILGGNYNTP